MLHRDSDRIPSLPTVFRPWARSDGDRLAAVARLIADAQPLWRHLVRHDPERRGYVRVLDTPEVEAWILTWTAQQAIELHDHGGSSGAVLVVDGELLESHTDRFSRGPLRRTRWRRGSTHVFDGSHVHDLQHAGGGHTTSIHVYSPPLSSMTFYEHQPGGLLKPVRVEPVEGAAHHAAPPAEASLAGTAAAAQSPHYAI